MSGGSHDYAYSKIDNIIEKIEKNENQIPEEILTKKLLRDLSKMLHDLEWWRSGDTSEENFIKSFKKFKNKWLKSGHRNKYK